MSSSILPPNATALERGLDTAVAERLAQIDIPLRDLWNPNTCPANLLPWLAWALAIVDWDSGWSEQQQRDVIRSAYYVHARRGTAGAVKESLAALGYTSAIKEWFQYPAGELLPYQFTADVNIYGKPVGNDDLFTAILTRINRAKNVRSHLARLRVTSPLTSDHYAGAAQSIGILCATGGPLEVLEEFQADTSAQFIAVAHASSPYVSAYSWDDDGGFGAKYSNPATLPGGDCHGVAFTPSGNAIALRHKGAPYISAYPFGASGFGTKYSNPSTLPGTLVDHHYLGDSLKFSPSADAVALTGSAAPYISAYRWSNAGFGTKYSDPATLPGGAADGLAFTPSGNAIAVAHAGSPYVSAYFWSHASGFGGKLSNPITLPAGDGWRVAFTPSGNAIAVAHAGAPYLPGSAYAWHSGSGFGTKYSDPATLAYPYGDAALAFPPAGNAIVFGQQAYGWSSGFGAKLSEPDGGVSGGVSCAAFATSGNAVALTHTAPSFVSAFRWNSASGFGTKYSNPSPWPSSSAYGVAFGKTN